MIAETPHQQVRLREPGQDRRALRPIRVLPYSLGDYFDVVRRQWIYLATLLPAAILIAVFLAFALPPMYLASGTILLEQALVPQDFVRTTVTTYADQQIELVQRRVMTIDTLTALVEDFDPYPDDHELSDRAKARLVSQNTRIEKVDPVTLEPLLQSSAFSIGEYHQEYQQWQSRLPGSKPGLEGGVRRRRGRAQSRSLPLAQRTRNSAMSLPTSSVSSLMNLM